MADTGFISGGVNTDDPKRALKRQVTNGAAHVSQNGAVTAASGQLKAHPITLADANPATATAGLIKGTFKAAWYTPTIVTIAAAEVVILGFSTDADDETNLGGQLTGVDTSLTTPDGNAWENVLVYSSYDLEVMKAIWDGTTAIKTLMARISGGATTVDGIIWTLE